MWKVMSMCCSDELVEFILVDVEDGEHWIKVDKARYQVLEDYGLILNTRIDGVEK